MIIEKEISVKFTGKKAILTEDIPVGKTMVKGKKVDLIERPNALEISYTEPGEVWYWNEEKREAGRLFRREYDLIKEKNHKTELTYIVRIDVEKEIQSLTYSMRDPSFELLDGWIDRDGNFYGIEQMSHETHNQHFKDTWKPEFYAHFFNNWVKVSCSAFSGIHFFASQGYLDTKIKNTQVTARQKLTIENYLNRHKRLLSEGESITFFGSGGQGTDMIICRENGQIKFRRD